MSKREISADLAFGNALLGRGKFRNRLAQPVGLPDATPLSRRPVSRFAVRRAQAKRVHMQQTAQPPGEICRLEEAGRQVLAEPRPALPSRAGAEPNAIAQREFLP